LHIGLREFFSSIFTDAHGEKWRSKVGLGKACVGHHKADLNMDRRERNHDAAKIK
jgi:hypothetical protein